MLTQPFRATGVVLIAAALLAGAARAEDVIHPKNGPEAKGRITKLEYDNLTYDISGKATSLKPEQVADFVLGDVPPKLREAESATRAKNYSGAIETLKALVADTSKLGRAEIHKQFVYLSLARAQRLGNDLAGARETLGKLRKECPKAWTTLDSFHESIEVEHADGNLNPTKVFAEWTQYPDPIKGWGELEQGIAKFQNSDAKGAQDIFARLTGSKSQPYALDAQLWNIRCLRALNRAAELEPVCAGILADENASMALQQAASAAQGDAFLAKAASDKKALKDALLAYTRAVSFGPPPKDADPSDYALALLNLGKTYAQLMAGAGKPELQTEYKSRAIGYFEEIKGHYGKTSWGKSADEELAKLPK